MIYTKCQDILASWLCDRIGLKPTMDLRCIGRLDAAGRRIIGVIGYDGWNGASVQMHVAGEGNWVNRAILYAAFDYPFRVCNVDMVLGMVPSGNVAALRFNTHLGFKVEHEIVGAHPDGSLIIMSMTRAECRWNRGQRHGQEIQRSTSAST